MSEQNRAWVREVLEYVCPHATKHWFKRSLDARVFASVYRAYRVPFLTGGYSAKPLVTDFGDVRAVFGRWDAPYQHIYQNLIEKADGQIGGQFHANVQRTGAGLLLLLMTPLPEGYDSNDADAAKEKVSFTRSFMVSLMGRNAAREHEFDMIVECGPRSVGALSCLYDPF